MINNGQQVNLEWWDHFLYLEELFLSTEKHVAFIKTNFTTTSITFMHIILAACADIECILKEVLELDSSKNVIDIGNVIKETYQDFCEIKISLPSLNCKKQPWLTLKNLGKKDKIPSWWDSYNNIKHNKNTGPYRGANLKYAIEALAGLFSVNLVYYTNKVGSNFSEGIKLPRFFDYPGLDANYRITGNSFNVNVTGFSIKEIA